MRLDRDVDPRPWWVLLPTVAWLATLAIAIDQPWVGPLQVLGALLLFFIVPGATLASLVWPSRAQIADRERLVLALGLSTALTVVMTVLLGVSPVGISGLSVAVGLTAVTTIGATASVVSPGRRRVRMADDGRTSRDHH